MKAQNFPCSPDGIPLSHGREGVEDSRVSGWRKHLVKYKIYGLCNKEIIISISKNMLRIAEFAGQNLKSTPWRPVNIP